MGAGRVKRWEWLIAPGCEAALILMTGLVAWATRSPMLFASLGPTAYELVETPNRPSARGYNVLMGHGCGIASGLMALWMLGQWGAKGSPGGEVTLMRVLVATTAALLTVMISLMAKATQPAAVASALVVALGSGRHLRTAGFMALAIVCLRLVGEPLRRWRLRRAPEAAGARGQN